jgi:phospholipid/cholesterol/gamma-HCH transport system ATP-binding protein
MTTPIIDIKAVKNQFGDQVIHKNINLTVYHGEILAIIGGSGSGKTTLLRNLLMLLKPIAGTITLFGHDISALTEYSINQLRRRFGVLFQHSALFSAMTVLENIMFPMQELAHMEVNYRQHLALLKLALVGLPPESADKFPSELSGGMQRRAAAARAIAMDPELLFLDEPTSGLDPISARKFDALLLSLKKTLNLTIVMISHDVESLKHITDRVAFVGQGEIISVAPLEQLMQNKHPLIVDYFSKY